jgi:hypothetical protein
MDCRFCESDRVTWRRTKKAPAYTYCRDCKRRNCEVHAHKLPHGENECDRAQLRLKI